MAFNHVGQCVTDLERSKRFYCELLGFACDREINPPDDLSAKLMGLTPPLGDDRRRTSCATASCSSCCTSPRPDRRSRPQPRAMNEPGLTHISLSVDDLDGVLARVAEFGGEVIADTNIGGGVFIKDPDGQLVELLPMEYRRRLDAGAGS